MVTERRIGEFKISRDFILDRPYDVLKVLSACIVIRCECMFDDNALVYVAYSHWFEPVPKGQLPNKYTTKLEECPNGNVNFRGFIKLN